MTIRLSKWTTQAVELTTTGETIDATYFGMFSLTGSASGKTVTTITGGAGAFIILLFNDSNCTIVNGANLMLSGSVDFAGANGDVLFLGTYDGTTWREVGRQQQAVTSPASTMTSLTVTGATALNGGLTMDTNKFIVADTTGDTTVGGTLSVTGATTLTGALAANAGITVDTTAFTVADTSGNVATTGTLTVGGAAALNGGITVDSTAFTVADTSGNVATSGTIQATGAITPTGGIAAAGGFTVHPSNFHTGGIPARVSTDGTDATPAVTETYIAAIFVPANCTITGVSVFLGSATEGNIKVGLADSAGAVVATSASTDCSGATVDAYLRVPFTDTYAAKGPATYYVLLLNDNTGNRFNAHAFGDFPTAKKTGEVYATGFTTITPPTTFTADLGPIASLF